MRYPSFLALFLIAACGGSIATTSDKQSSSGSSGEGSTSGGTGNSGGGTSGAAGSSGTSTGTANVRCTPGNYVFCRCADRSEGTKLCKDDGASFDACTCDTPVCSYPVANNPPGCPATYAPSYGGEPCDAIGLECSYPGAGEAPPGSCAGNAQLSCRPQPGGALRWLATP